MIVPFMEFLLPVCSLHPVHVCIVLQLALKIFPNMLPSTFADKDKEARASVAGVSSSPRPKQSNESCAFDCKWLSSSTPP